MIFTLDNVISLVFNEYSAYPHIIIIAYISFKEKRKIKPKIQKNAPLHLSIIQIYDKFLDIYFPIVYTIFTNYFYKETHLWKLMFWRI